jgi:1,4-alpha-glucan branching enzyme
VLVVCNFTPIPRTNYRVGVPEWGFWHELLNGDAEGYGGSGWGNYGGVEASEIPMHGRPWSLELTLPPLACVYLKHERR